MCIAEVGGVFLVLEDFFLGLVSGATVIVGGEMFFDDCSLRPSDWQASVEACKVVWMTVAGEEVVFWNPAGAAVTRGTPTLSCLRGRCMLLYKAGLLKIANGATWVCLHLPSQEKHQKLEASAYTAYRFQRKCYIVL